MQNTRLVRTRVGGDPHTLVVRSATDDPTPLDLPTAADPDDVLAVTFGDPDALLDAWGDRARRPPRNVGVVDVGGRMRSAAAESAPAPGPNVISGVADPTDAAAIRDAMAGHLDAWPARGRAVAYFDSVTALLDRVGVAAATDFLSDVFRLLDECDAVGYFCLTPSVCAPSTVREVKSLFDTVVECIDRDAPDCRVKSRLG